MRTFDFVQGTPEWLAARAGRVTASRISDVMATIKSGEAAARADYKAELVVEILTGKPSDDSFISYDMKLGTEREPFARAAYEVKYETMVDQVGFVVHPTIDRAGASPDGLIGSEGSLEIKCPKMKTHMGYLMAGVVPSKYRDQMQWQMACCERTWSEFVSFHPDFPPDLQLFVVRLERDQARIDQITAEVQKLLVEVDAIVAKFKKEE